MSIFLLINMGALSLEGAKSQIKNEVVKYGIHRYVNYRAFFLNFNHFRSSY